MWRQAWLKLLVCTSNFAETGGYLRAESKDLDGKQKQTIRMTSFQELCSIVISVSEPVEPQDGIQKIETSISNVLKELTDPDESDVIQQLKEVDQSSAESNGDILSDPVNGPSSVQNPLPEQTDEASPLLADVNTEATSLSSANTNREAVLQFSANISTKEASPLSSNTNIAAVPPLLADASREAAFLLSAIACLEEVSPLPADVSKEAALTLSADASAEAAWPFSDSIDGSGASSFLTDVNTEEAVVANANRKAAAESILEAAVPLSAHVETEAAIPLSDDINLGNSVQLPVDAHAKAALPLLAGAHPEGKEMSLDDQITEVDENLQEYASAFIQIAVKRFSVEKDLSQHKIVTKLQDDFVPKDAAGAFQFYRRINKIQELFKTHHAHQSQKKQSACKKVTKKSQEPFLRKKPKVPFLQKKLQESDISGKKIERISTLKLLNNVLAYQLTESTPQTNSNHLPNDPTKPNSAWQWLERLISHKSDIQQQQDSNSSKVVEVVDEQSDVAGSEETKIAVAADTSVLDDLSTNKEGDQLQTNPQGKTIQVLLSTTDTKVDSAASSSKEEAQYNKEDLGTKDNILVSSNSSQVAVEPVTPLENSSSENPMLEIESPTNPTERIISKHVGTERKQFSVRTRRELNSTVTTQPTKGEKFSMLQVANISAKNEGQEGEYQLVQSHITCSAKVSENSSADSISHEPDMKIHFHQCSTQIPSEPPKGASTGIDKKIPDIKPRESEEKCNTIANANAKSTFDADSNMDKDSWNSQVILQNSNEKNTRADEAHDELHLEESHTSSISMKLKNAKAPEVFPSLLAGSPRSALLQESQGENMLTSAKNKAHLPKQPRSPLAQMSPHSCSKNDSSGRSSTEHLPKDVKTSKNSFAGPKPDHDTRISNGNAIPSYMQTTESVRAKFHSDLKSIPGMQEKDNNFVKKRHSVHIEHSKLGLSTNMQ